MAKDYLFWVSIVVAVVFSVVAFIAYQGNKRWKKYEDEHASWFGDRNG